MKITIVDGVIVKNNKLLLLKKFTKDYYELPGGKLKPGEELSSCLLRELEEEVGIKVKHFKKIKELKFNFENKEIQDNIFLVEGFEGEIQLIEKDVFERLIWQDINKLGELNLAPNIQKISSVLSSFQRKY